MTTTIAGIDNTPTSVAAIRDWVASVADLTTPDAVVWCDGSDDEWRTADHTSRGQGHLRAA